MAKSEDWLTRQFPTTERAKGKQHPLLDVGDFVFKMLCYGAQSYGKLLLRRPYYTVPGAYILYRLSGYIVKEAYHLKFLNYIEPEIFTFKVLQWFYRFDYYEHLWAVVIFLAIPVILYLGFQVLTTQRKYQRIFEAAGLMNHLKETPVLTLQEKLRHGRMRLTFDSKGIGISQFRNAQDALASSFNSLVQSIELGTSPKFVVITLSSKKMMEFVTYGEIEKMEQLLPYSFYLGMTSSGPRQIAIADLPHMLAAGTTGAGKSIFFKQSVLGLITSSPHMQLYLIDLKGGLEMVDFKDAPNVRVIKSMTEAVMVLRKIKAEMRSRFGFLETKGLKEINPKRDKKDRIVVGVDEASVLYMNRSSNDTESTLAAQAREITDDIAKLSRAAAIHLILSTQKVSKETVQTFVQENISARMSFKMNTVQGSSIVIGTNEAMNLPDTKGCGIWSFGGQTFVVQVPYVSEDDIVSRCRRIAEDFSIGQRSLFNPMIETLKVGQVAPLPFEKALETGDGSAPLLPTNGTTVEDSASKVSWYLYENKVATVDQVHRDLFPNLTRRAVAKKLAGLEESGYVESANYSELPRQKAFHVTPKAFRQFVEPNGSNLSQTLRSEVVLHDLALVDIRHRLESDPRVKSFQTENVVSSNDKFVSINPDGIFELVTDGKSFSMALEYESAKKTPERYKELFEVYYSEPSISGVLFICRDAEILRAVHHIEPALKPASAKVYYSQYDTWDASGEVTFTSMDGKSIRITPVPAVPPEGHVEPGKNLGEEAKC